MNSGMSAFPWMNSLKGDPLPWLLEEQDPEVRYLTLRDLLDRPANDPELFKEKSDCCHTGMIARVLEEMNPAGYWVKPGPGYYPTYRGTVWAVIMLAQMGADWSMDGRIATACQYLLEQNMGARGIFSYNGNPSGTVDCLQGNLCESYLEIGWEDPRLEVAFEWMARSVTGEGVAPKEDRKAEQRYYAGKCGPGFLCGANYGLPCGWGAAKVMLAFGRLPESRRTPLINRAIQMGMDFLLSVDPATADYPRTTKKPNRCWWQFGFPVFYHTDILQVAEGLALLGYGQDPRLHNALDLILSKQDESGQWALEYSYQGKIWVEVGNTGEVNKWVTLRVLRLLKNIWQISPI
jgi:hypothetical protein